jgi:hypothetical protein
VTALADQYRILTTFLKAHEKAWLYPILPDWPESRAHYPAAWLKALGEASVEEQRLFEDVQVYPGMPEDLRQLIESAASVVRIDVVKEEWPLDVMDLQGLNLKKQHEIQRLLPLLEREASGLENAVDIGGGMGHLARTCVKYFHWNFHSIDRNRELQEKGRWWRERSRTIDKSKLNFVEAEFSNEADETVDALFAQDKSLSIGLHTCGPLALSQFQKSLRSSLIVNFGCCYDKMDLSKDLNRSALAQEIALRWSQPSLFLATRGRKGMTIDEFALLKRVNAYRFAIDLFFRERYPELGFVIAGDAPKALYAEDFSAYARNRFEKLGMPAHHSALELKAFYERQDIQEEIRSLFAAHMIQNVFSRPLELAILMDRALWLEEQGFDVKALEVFDRNASPRNIAIIAHRKT